MLFRNTDSPNRQSKQPFHHEFISDLHIMDYDVELELRLQYDLFKRPS